jgi:hypothetical protein
LLGELEQFQEFVIAPPDPLPRTETVIDNERDSMLRAEAAKQARFHAAGWDGKLKRH